MFVIRKSLVAVLAVAVISTGIGGWKFPDLKSALKIQSTPEISKQAEAHILHGDKAGGGHLHGTGKPCKTEFPANWDADDIIANVRKVAANDNLPWKQQKNGYHVAAQTIDDVRVRVVLDEDKDGVVTAYPLDGKMNVCKTRSSGKKARNAKAKRPARAQVEETAQNTAPQKSYNFNR